MRHHQEHLQDCRMAYDDRKNRLRRHDAVGMDELVSQFIREMKLSSGLDKVRAADAWNAVSGAGRYTLGVRYEGGVMTCMLSSSVVRNQLYFQRDELVRRLNEYFAENPLCSGDTSAEVVRTLILR